MSASASASAPSTRTKRSTVKAHTVGNLKQWVSWWPKDKTLGFNPETREPVVYEQDSGPAETRTIKTSIAWKRRADVLTVLSLPSQFSAQTVQVARTKYAAALPPSPDVAQFQAAEARLLDAWRAYSGAAPGDKTSLRSDIQEAQAYLTALEVANANAAQPDRQLKFVSNGCTSVTTLATLFVQPIPIESRGIKMDEVR